MPWTFNDAVCAAENLNSIHTYIHTDIHTVITVQTYIHTYMHSKLKGSGELKKTADLSGRAKDSRDYDPSADDFGP